MEGEQPLSHKCFQGSQSINVRVSTLEKQTIELHMSRAESSSVELPTTPLVKSEDFLLLLWKLEGDVFC